MCARVDWMTRIHVAVVFAGFSFGARLFGGLSDPGDGADWIGLPVTPVDDRAMTSTSSHLHQAQTVCHGARDQFARWKLEAL